MAATVIVQAGIEFVDPRKTGFQDGKLRQFIRRKELGAEPVVQVVVVIGNIVGDSGHLRLRAGIGVEFEVLPGLILDKGPRELTGDRAVVFGNAFKGFPCEVQPVKLGIVAFEIGDDPKRLCVVIETAVRRHGFGQRIFPGVSERRVSKVVGQRDGLGQFGIETERTGYGTRHLCHFNGMRETRAEIVALMFDEDLCLVFQPAERARMNDAVAVALKAGTKGAFVLVVKPAPTVLGARRVRGGHAPACLACPDMGIAGYRSRNTGEFAVKHGDGFPRLKVNAVTDLGSRRYAPRNSAPLDVQILRRLK